ncbi:MAG: ABC transporter permease [Planctomycetota bacterium]
MSGSIGISEADRSRIGRQITLPFRKAFEVAWKGIKIRIWRSLITMSGIVLAIAFLMSVWTSGVFTDAMRRVGPEQALYPLVQSVLEAKALSGGGVNVRTAVMQSEGRQQGVDPAAAIRYALEGADGFRAEQLPPEAEAALNLLREEKALQPDGFVLVGFPGVVADPELSAALKDYVRGGGFLLIYGAQQLENSEALAEMLPATAGQGTLRVEAASAQPSGQAAAIGVPWSEMPPVEVLVTRARGDSEAILSAHDRGVVWTGDFGRGKVSWFPLVSESAVSEDVLSWFVRGRRVGAGGAGEARKALLARLVAHGSREKLEAGGGGTRGIWLVTLSLMVCVVGITNAMLMSVTERFREIGTMKCLGALDIFVVKLFLIESTMQGVVGSLAGAVIGFLLAFVRALFTFHVADPETGEGYFMAFHFFPAGRLALWFLVALITGIVLSVVAAVYPAIRAARMEPVQAMRVEE